VTPDDRYDVLRLSRRVTGLLDYRCLPWLGEETGNGFDRCTGLYGCRTGDVGDESLPVSGRDRQVKIGFNERLFLHGDGLFVDPIIRDDWQ